MNAGFGYGRAFGPHMMGDGLGAFGFGGYGLLATFALLVVVAIVVAIVVWAVTRKRTSDTPTPSQTLPSAPPAQDTALAIARERLARGEIDPEQYAAIVNALRT
jgi:uncharacterized membrane protein